MKLSFSKSAILDYLLDKNPEFSIRSILPFLILFGLMFSAGIIIPWVLKKNYKNSPPFEKLASKILTPLVTFSLIGLILLFFNWQAIPYLASRVLILLLYLVFLIWLIFLSKYIQKDFKKEIIAWQNRLRKMKYIPEKRR